MAMVKMDITAAYGSSDGFLMGGCRGAEAMCFLEMNSEIAEGYTGQWREGHQKRRSRV